MIPADACQLHPVEHPTRRVTGGSACREKGAPRLSPSSLHVCTSIEGKMCLRQTRCADMPDASDPFASRLAGARIT
jgi:hypothetical protein